MYSGILVIVIFGVFHQSFCVYHLLTLHSLNAKSLIVTVPSVPSPRDVRGRYHLVLDT